MFSDITLFVTTILGAVTPIIAALFLIWREQRAGNKELKVLHVIVNSRWEESMKVMKELGQLIEKDKQQKEEDDREEARMRHSDDEDKK